MELYSPKTSRHCLFGKSSSSSDKYKASSLPWIGNWVLNTTNPDFTIEGKYHNTLSGATRKGRTFLNINKFTFSCQIPCIFQIFVVPVQRFLNYNAPRNTKNISSWRNKTQL